jgi:hypothetical protein
VLAPPPPPDDGAAAKLEARRARGRRDTAKWRTRVKAGRQQLKVEVDEADFGAAAISAGLLDPAVADDVVALTRAAEEVLALFAAGELSPRGVADVDNIRARLLEAAAHDAIQLTRRGRDQSATDARNAAPAPRRDARSGRAKAGR